jgi:hypothetical protein
MAEWKNIVARLMAFIFTFATASCSDVVVAKIHLTLEGRDRDRAEIVVKQVLQKMGFMENTDLSKDGHRIFRLSSRTDLVVKTPLSYEGNVEIIFGLPGQRFPDEISRLFRSVTVELRTIFGSSNVNADQETNRGQRILVD